MLNYSSGENNYGEYNDNTVKESRKTRSQKLAIKQFYHRKNPKSMAYYQQQPILDTIINTNKTVFLSLLFITQINRRV